MPFAPKHKFRGGGGGGAVGRTDGQTMAGAGGGGGGGGKVWADSILSAFGGVGFELVLGLAQMACTLLINHCPDDKIVSRVQ